MYLYIEYMLTQEWYMFYVMTTSSRYASEGGVSLSEYIGYQQWISRMSVQFRGVDNL